MIECKICIHRIVCRTYSPHSEPTECTEFLLPDSAPDEFNIAHKLVIENILGRLRLLEKKG